MGTCTCDPEDPNRENTLQRLTVKLESYANNKNLMQFNRATREMLQRLFVLNQSHVGDRLMTMIQNKSEEKDAFMSDLSKINLQQFDEICHASTASLGKSQTKTISSQREFLRIGQQYIQQGENCLRKLKFLFVVTAMCFGNKDDYNPTQPTDLLSRKSRIQVLIQKAEAFRLRYKCDIKICVIYSKKMPINKQLQRNSKIEFIVFQPNQPCFCSESKIKLYGNSILFNEQEGDLLHYLFNSSIKHQISDYAYINFCDIKNLACPLINPAHLGYLNLHTRINILATVKNAIGSKYCIKNQFINKELFQFGDILVKTSVLKEVNKYSNSYEILNMRIQRKLMKGFDNCYVFTRLPQDILYADWAQLTKIPYSACNRQEYSNFCKQILGVENTNEGDVVEISPSILYGQQSELIKIRNSLRNQNRDIGFPLLVMKSNPGQI